DCHLMMNPEEISEAENAFGFSERKTARLEIPMERTTEIDFPIEGSSSSTSSDKYSINSSVEYAKRSTNNERMNALMIYCQHTLTTAGWSAYAADALSHGADPELVKDFKEYWSKAKESLDAEDYPLTMSWIQILEYLQAGIEESMNPTFAHLKTGNLSEYWNPAFRAMLQTARYRAQLISASLEIFRNSHSAANCYGTLDFDTLGIFHNLRSDVPCTFLGQADLEKAFMFEQSPEIVNEWKKVIEQSESFAVLFTEYWRKAAEAWLSGNEEYTPFCPSSRYESEQYRNFDLFMIYRDCNLNFAFNSLGKAAIAEKSGKEPISALYQKSAEQSVFADKCHQKMIEARASGMSFKFSYWNNAKEAAESSAQQFHDTAISLKKVYETSVNIRLLSKFATANEVQGVDGAQNLSVQTSSIVRALERRSNLLAEVEFRKKSSINCQQSATTFWKNAAKAWLGVKNTKSKQSIITLWEKATEQHQFAAEQYQLSAEYNKKFAETEYGKGFSYEEYKKIINAASLASSSAHRLDQTASSLEASIEAEKKGYYSLSELYQKAALAYQVAYEYGQKAAEAETKGNTYEYENFTSATRSADSSAEYLYYNSSSSIREAIKAEKSGNTLLASLWREAGEQYQIAAQCEQKVAEAQASRNTFECERLKAAVETAKLAADALKKQAQEL
ncbi:MAG TPA: hypothetical protein VJK54_10080, partial [Chthoniobacterales bacterium]|nr:hypothetical protein [Chthoniobacterales bacterium]